jgi:hypothetical protein
MNIGKHINRILDVLYHEYISYGMEENVMWCTKSFDLIQIKTMIFEYNISLIENLSINEVDEHTLSWGDNKRNIVITTSVSSFNDISKRDNPKMVIFN